MFFNWKKTLQNSLTDGGETLQVWPPINEEQKVPSFWWHAVGHMIWQPYWIYPETFKNPTRQNGLTDQGEFSHTFPKPGGYKGVHE